MPAPLPISPVPIQQRALEPPRARLVTEKRIDMQIWGYILGAAGNRHHDHPSPSTAVAAQKKPALAPHAHAVGFSILGVMMLVTMPDML